MAYSLPKIVRKKKRVGRGWGSRGAKSGRGQKGQKSRAGYSRKAGFEGGQTPLYMRLPKGRGSKQNFPSQIVKATAITIKALNRFEGGSIIGPGVLRKAGLLSGKTESWKLIGNDKLSKKFTVRANAITAGARKAVESAGGKVELMEENG